MTDFLLELRSEEIPARMQAKAREDLARLFAAELGKAGLVAGETVTYATPRRLALIVRGLPEATDAVSEEVKGPKASAPPQALEGFLRKTGLTREQLVERDGTLFAVAEKPGRATAQVLAEAIPAVLRAFPWPKSMRWGAASASTESPRWVRPLQGIVAIFGEELVPVEVAGVASGYATLGHRFHHPGVITIGGAHDYVEKLRACHVVVDQDERAALIRERAQALAAEAGLELVEDEGLVVENAGLTEWPVPLLGRFDEAFLEVPPEVIQLTARVNQKYFVCRSVDGRLANAFICTANIDATDGGAKIVEGNRKVLAARLSDARFFYETDLKVPLEEQAKKLEKIVFHEKLGTVADKVERVAKLARWLVEEGIVTDKPLPSRGGVGVGAVHGRVGLDETATPHPNPSPEGEGLSLAVLAERAARLAKADLVTGMVGEFPELQGLMGGYYAQAQGEPREVWEAVRDHYKPVGQGDEVPTAPVTVAVSLADKLDTLGNFFAIDEAPTGSKDPYALRRAGLGLIGLIVRNDLRHDVLLLAFYVLLRSPALKLHQSPTAAMAEAFAAVIEAFPADVGLEATKVLLPTIARTPSSLIKPEIAVEAFSKTVTVRDFLLDRLEVMARSIGTRADIIRAAKRTADGIDSDLVRLLARVHALQAFVRTEDGANLLAGYKRAANILKKEGYAAPLPLAGGAGGHPASEGADRSASSAGPPPTQFGVGRAPGTSSTARGAVDPELARGRGEEGLSYTPEPAEGALIAALDSAEPAAAQAVAAEDFERAMAALASLRAPIDAFFDSVTVNDPDPAKREARLRLLARVRAAVHTVADFSKIEG